MILLSCKWLPLSVTNGPDTGFTQLPACEGPLGYNEQGHYGNIFPGLQSRLSLSPPQ